MLIKDHERDKQVHKQQLKTDETLEKTQRPLRGPKLPNGSA